MKEQKVKIILLHIMEDLQDIELFLQNISKEEFLTSSMIKKAVSMSLLNIGELSKELPAALTTKYPDIPWVSIVGLRNRTAHGYHGLDPEIIWNICNKDLKEFEKVIAYEIQQINK
ncbi:MAG: DUF86 domain-containing protein [Peptococcaceae bacterium]|nr:DUF86 domain-containing protein [Peptococcaceae bacterium]